ncbi:MAG: hypothetical protein CMN64_23730 [Sphingobium sp.]|nr:hypothetical protein [Sphingobium sp.]
MPVAPERLEHVCQMVFDKGFAEIDGYQRMEILKLTMQADQLEQAQLTNFFLQEAYDIYNARFR